MQYLAKMSLSILASIFVSDKNRQKNRPAINKLTYHCEGSNSIVKAHIKLDKFNFSDIRVAIFPFLANITAFEQLSCQLVMLLHLLRPSSSFHCYSFPCQYFMYSNTQFLRAILATYFLLLPFAPS